VKNEVMWQESKFTIKNDVLVANKKSVGPGSFFIASIQGAAYQKCIERYAKGDLVDLGCGMAPLYKAYRDKCKSILCIDWEFSLQKSPYVDIYVNLEKPLEIPSEKFDTVIITDVIAHVFNPQLLINEAFRILRSGGNLILASPFFYFICEPPYDYYRYTQYALKRLLSEAGFKTIELYEYGGIFEIFFDLSSKILQPTGVFGYAWGHLGLQLRKFPLIIKLSQRSAKQFPLGYVVVGVKI
jgi:SAM-dependent methyltransferase